MKTQLFIVLCVKLIKRRGLSVQIGALADHYLLVRRSLSSVSKRLGPKHTAALNADSRASNILHCLQYRHRHKINFYGASQLTQQRLTIVIKSAYIRRSTNWQVLCSLITSDFVCL